MSIDKTLNERGSRYGDFTDHARICQSLKRTMMRQPGWDRLPDIHKQALDVIADKIARILSGDPLYADNWHDIQGYAKLVEDRLGQFDKAMGESPMTGSWAGKAAEPLTGPQTPLDETIKKIDEQIQASLIGRAREGAKDVVAEKQCDCPGCTFRRALQEMLGPDVEVEMVRVDPRDFGSGPTKH